LLLNAKQYQSGYYVIGIDMKKSLIFFYLLSTLSYSSYSQTWQWVQQKSAPSMVADYGWSVCADNQGNCYSAGELYHSATVFKYNSAGSSIWDLIVWSFGTVKATTFDNGSIYAVGDSSNQIKIVKCDTSGNIIWKVDAGTGNGNGISYDNAGYLYVTGSSIFLSKYDTLGNLIWSRTVNATGNAIVSDSIGNSYITGYFSGTAVFNDTLISKGNRDIFIAKYDSAGNCLWGKRAGSNLLSSLVRNDCGYGIAKDQQENIYVTGSIIDTADFESFTLIASNNDVFLAKYDPNGNVIWVKQVTGGSDQEGRCVSVDNQNNILVGGSYVPNADFSGFSLSGWGNYDAFVAKYDSSGNFINVLNAGASPWNEYVYGICSDASGNSFVTGNFSDNSTFGPFVLFSYGPFDIFTGKIDMITGINGSRSKPSSITIYPNPATDQITVEFEAPNAVIEIKNTIGQTVYSEIGENSLGKHSMSINTSYFSSGLYLLTMKNDKGIVSQKFIKQ
jgi:hypothetical protein